VSSANIFIMKKHLGCHKDRFRLRVRWQPSCKDLSKKGALKDEASVIKILQSAYGKLATTSQKTFWCALVAADAFCTNQLRKVRELLGGARRHLKPKPKGQPYWEGERGVNPGPRGRGSRGIPLEPRPPAPRTFRPPVRMPFRRPLRFWVSLRIGLGGQDKLCGVVLGAAAPQEGSLKD
jgi:hypothetical protein